MKNELKLLVVPVLCLFLAACLREDEVENGERPATSEPDAVVENADLPYEKLSPQAVLTRVGSDALTKADVERELDMQERLFGLRTPSADRREKFAEGRLLRARNVIQQFESKSILMSLVRERDSTPTADARKRLETRYVTKFAKGKGSFDDLCHRLEASESAFRARFEYDLLTDDYMHVAHSNEWQMTAADVETLQKRYRTISTIGAATNELVRARAEDVVRRLKGGEPFAALADAFSEDETKEPGGSLGACTANSFTQEPEVWTAVAALKEGEVSDVIETEYSFYVMRRDAPPADDPTPGKGELYLSEIYFQKAQTFPDYSLEEVRLMGEKERYEELVAKLIKERRASMEIVRPRFDILFPLPANVRLGK